MAGDLSFGELVDRAATLARGTERALLGVCGPPGAGKSTLAVRLVRALEPDAVYVGMDGFHLAQVELTRLGRAERKGAPDTFDAAGYVSLLRRLRRQSNRDAGDVGDPGDPGDPGDIVYAPQFHREIEEPVAGAVPVLAHTPLVVTEGNYLLLPDPPWHRIRQLLDEAWFLALDEDERRRRLIARHVSFGRSPEQARQRALGPDERNAVRINATRHVADLVIERLHGVTTR